MSLNKVNGIWYVKCKSSAVVEGESLLRDGDIFVLDSDAGIAVYVYEEKIDDTRQISMAYRDSITIGRSSECDVVLADKYLSSRHLRIVKRKRDGVFGVISLSGTNPIFLNHKRLDNNIYKLEDNYVISFNRYNLVFHEKDQSFTLRHMVDVSTEERGQEYPYWYEPTPRLLSKLPDDKFEIDPVPPSMQAMEFNIVQFATSAVSAVTSAAMMSPIGIMSLTGQLANNEIYKKKAKAYEARRQEKYGKYLDDKEKELTELKAKQRHGLETRSPGLWTLRDILYKKDAGLWDRKISDDDFMKLRLGIGEGEISFSVNGPRDCFTMVEDNLENRARSIVKDSKIIKDIPIDCDFLNKHLIGIIGDRASGKRAAKKIILQAAAHHSYEDLKIVIVYDEHEKADFSWTRWLPHTFSENRDIRYVCGNRKSTQEIMLILKDEFENRCKQAGNSGFSRKAVMIPHYLFVFTQVELTKKQEILHYLLMQNKDFDLGASVLYIFDRLAQLPSECNTIIKVSGMEGELIDKADVSSSKKFIFDDLNDKEFEAFARKMAPMRLAERKDEASLPHCVTLLEGLNVKRPEEIPIEDYWSNTRPHKSLAVPIGVTSEGDPFIFDIHEKQHGVHGLVAGTTGSGKSEMVQSWIVSMALHFPPDEVSFVLIDFKGTGLIRPFRELPHLAGTISNLDKKIQRNLFALRHELVRRQELLDECKEKTGIEVNDITDYLTQYKAGRISEPMPYLFIVIDEFAEFKVQFPDFMAEVESVFKIGRALGVFAILLTQAPGGVVTEQMEKNLRFRWCLKVGSPSDSNEVIHHTDAARITNPGRAYVRVGNDEVYELVQSYFSGAKYEPEQKEEDKSSKKVYVVEEDGNRYSYEKNDIHSNAGKVKKAQISVVVEYLHRYASDNGIKNSAQVWLEKMPFEFPLDKCSVSNYKNGKWKKDDYEGIAPIIGLLDDPHNQKQYPLRLDFAADGHIVVYGAPGTGKTTFLQTAIMSMIRTYSPEDLNIYIMDFGGKNLSVFKEFPHIGGIANDDEPEIIGKLTQFIERQIELRKELFSKVGVGNINVYEQLTGEHLPVIILVLDNFAPVYQLYPDIDQFFINLTRQGASYGVYLLASSNSQQALGFRVTMNIKKCYALNQSDKSEYNGLVGRTEGLEPENKFEKGRMKIAEGRGLAQGSPVLEFQTALPMEAENIGDIINRIRASAADMKNEYHGVKAKPLPIMPDNIELFDLPEGTIGYTLENMEEVYLPENDIHYMLVTGPKGSGKTNMLKILKHIFSLKQNSKIVFADVSGKCNLIEADNTLYLGSAEKIDEFILQLRPELERRADAYEKGEKDFDDIYILLDDYDVAAEQIGEMTRKLLEAIINLGKGLHVFLVISCEHSFFDKYSTLGEIVLAHFKKNQFAFLTGERIRDYAVLSEIDATDEEKTYRLKNKETCMIDKGRIKLFKTAYGG